MSWKTRLAAWPLFWKIYIFIVALLVFVVSLVELVFEPLAESGLISLSGGLQPWHEAALWGLSILFPALACGYILSRAVSGKLEKMARASQELAQGDLTARLPVTGNDRDPFDVLARSFNDMAGAVESQRHHERRLLADISHELRSPLARMAIAIELLARRSGETERAALTRRLEKEAAHMNELVAHLLAQAREKAAGRAGPVDLNALLTDLAADFAFQGEALQKDIRLRLENGLLVYGNFLFLQRMSGNIISNALFYAPPKSRVEIEAGRSGREIRLSVRDYGPGVPEAQLEDIFRPFYRVDGSRARTSGGAGLGLALAREDAVYHGGRIKASNAGPGLRVTVTLPAHVNAISK